ncbi:hypothetical protein KIN34_01220 [Cellulomonas sp. DKR-3]|uniref:DUF222 domain-containing protein n=1 Tax=Cellulomonas fulva TaxID=2835530 RepID=A0ABS5TUU2_9CELL|nr:hypothetical protein [Cellulomonas fulva]MBT0992911.1 hypothetical protein [Cellulomonas fulva]
MRIGLALRELHRDEGDLASELLRVSDRHAVDHEIFYVARDLAVWSQDHVREIARIARDYDEDLDPDAATESSLVARLRDKGSELVGRRAAPGLELLRDLREVYLMASGVSVDWELVAQAAQGLKHRELVELTGRCHAETLRQVRWANGKLKESATQVLVS